MQNHTTQRRGLVAQAGQRRNDTELTRTHGGRETVLKLLNDALETEIFCVHRYKRHYGIATGIKAATVAREFLEHSIQEQHQVYRIVERIVQLGGEPDFRRSNLEDLERRELLEMIREDLAAERIAMDYYAEVLQQLSDRDTAIRRLIEDIVGIKMERTMSLTATMDTLSESRSEESGTENN